MNSILKNKKFKNTKCLFIVCYDDSQEACVLEAIDSCNEDFKWRMGVRPTRYKSKGIIVHEYFNYGKCTKYNRYIICIDLKKKQLTYIFDNENLDNLRIANNLLERDYLNYLAPEFLDVIKVKSILDDKEKEYLSAVIRPFKSRVITITKVEACCDPYIRIKVKSFDKEKDIDCGYLPKFKSDTMYKGMESNKDYTLKELDLD